VRRAVLTCVTGIQLIAAPHKAQPLLLYQLVEEDQIEVTCARGMNIKCRMAPITVPASTR
jgi:hypothetical protein